VKCVSKDEPYRVVKVYTPTYWKFSSVSVAMNMILLEFMSTTCIPDRIEMLWILP